jgi:hypothetical protein
VMVLQTNMFSARSSFVVESKGKGASIIFK